MTAEQAPARSLYRKLAEVMGECGYVKKNGYNAFHRYNYVTEADLVDAVREKLAARNVALIPSVSSIDERPFTTEKGKQSVVTTVHVAFTFCDGDSGETHRAEWAGSGDDLADKGLYKAYTGALKYFLMKAFLIPTGDDPEADEATDSRVAAAPAVRQPAPVNRAPLGQSPLSAGKRELVLNAITNAGLNTAAVFAAVGLDVAVDMTATHAVAIREHIDAMAARP